MINQTVVTEPPLLDEIRDKTFDQILREQAQERNEDPTKPLEETPQETDDEKKKKEDEAKAEEAKQKADAEAAQKKHDEELSAKAAEEAVSKLQAEEQAKVDKLQAEADEKKRQEDLKPKFTGKDKDGNVVPISYDELHAEDVRIAEERAVARIHAEQKAADEAKQAELAQQSQATERQKTEQKRIEEQLQSELDSDLKDLYAAGKMPKIGDPKDENDQGNKEFKNLFETAQRVNGERLAQGLPPIRSIKLIYYEHYKPLTPPPGHDAPVLGNESPLSKEAPEDQYVPARDRNKSIQQLIREETARLGRKLNVRGN